MFLIIGNNLTKKIWNNYYQISVWCLKSFFIPFSAYENAKKIKQIIVKYYIIKISVMWCDVFYIFKMLLRGIETKVIDLLSRAILTAQEYFAKQERRDRNYPV